MELSFEDAELSYDESKKLVIVKNEGRRSYPKIREFIKEMRLQTARDLSRPGSVLGHLRTSRAARLNVRFGSQADV